MAVYTPTHRQALFLIYFAHLGYVSVASGTFLAGSDVHRVIELYVLGQEVDLLPSDGFAGVVRFGDLLNPGAIDFHDHMAVHADVERGNRSVARNFNTGVTVLAIDLQFAGVESVFKRDGLIGLITLIVSDNHFVIGQCPNKDT